MYPNHPTPANPQQQRQLHNASASVPAPTPSPAVPYVIPRFPSQFIPPSYLTHSQIGSYYATPSTIPTNSFYRPPNHQPVWNMLASPNFSLPESPIRPVLSTPGSLPSSVFRPVNNKPPPATPTKKRKLVKRGDLDAIRTSLPSAPSPSTPLSPIEILVSEFPGVARALISRTVANSYGDIENARAQCRRIAGSAHLSARLNALSNRVKPSSAPVKSMPPVPPTRLFHSHPTVVNPNIDPPPKRRSLRSRKSLTAANAGVPVYDSQTDLGHYSSDDDSDSDVSGRNQRVVKRTVNEGEAVDFFNTASALELVEYTQGTLDQAEMILTLRPFRSKDDISRKLSAAKGLSSRLLDNYDAVNHALVAVDDVIQQCEQISAELAECMIGWPDACAPVFERKAGSQFLLKRQPNWINPDFDLKSYQVIGVSWLVLLHQRQLSGILADEMGLGKTAQVIAYILHMHELGNKGPFLVICPSSTLDNWMREFHRWVHPDRLGVDIVIEAYAGSASERYTLGRQILASDEPRVSVVVTTYSFANSKDDRAFLKRMQFAAMIVDEGHALKNAESQRFKSLNQVKAPFRLLLTGTPLQNNLTELLSLLTFILPHLFSPVETEWRRLLKLKSIDTISSRRLLQVRKVMVPFVLRRKKLQVLVDLPPKSVRIQHCELHESQKDLYTELVAASCADLANGETKQFKAHFMDLRKAAIHPLLFRKLYSDSMCHEIADNLLNEVAYQDGNLAYMVEDMLLYSDFDIHRLCLKFDSTRRFALQDNEWMHSAKVDQLCVLLKECKARGDRCLLFSQFTMALDILENALNTVGYKYLRIDGTTSVVERQPLVDQFYEEEDILVFLLSTKAGGQGLNLAAANVVILHDLDFNPHNDNQAEDRAWRLGQTRPVEVVKLVCTGTIEEAICQRQHMKLKLDHKLANATEESGDVVMDDGTCEREIMRLVAAQLGGLLEKDTPPSDGAKLDIMDGDAKEDTADIAVLNVHSGKVEAMGPDGGGRDAMVKMGVK